MKKNIVISILVIIILILGALLTYNMYFKDTSNAKELFKDYMSNTLKHENLQHATYNAYGIGTLTKDLDGSVYIDFWSSSDNEEQTKLVNNFKSKYKEVEYNKYLELDGYKIPVDKKIANISILSYYASGGIFIMLTEDGHIYALDKDALENEQEIKVLKNIGNLENIVYVYNDNSQDPGGTIIAVDILGNSTEINDYLN